MNTFSIALQTIGLHESLNWYKVREISNTWSLLSAHELNYEHHLIKQPWVRCRENSNDREGQPAYNYSGNLLSTSTLYIPKQEPSIMPSIIEISRNIERLLQPKKNTICVFSCTIWLPLYVFKSSLRVRYNLERINETTTESRQLCLTLYQRGKENSANEIQQREIHTVV